MITYLQVVTVAFLLACTGKQEPALPPAPASGPVVAVQQEALPTPPSVETAPKAPVVTKTLKKPQKQTLPTVEPSSAPASPVSLPVQTQQLIAGAPTHAGFDTLLQQFVSNDGKVNYKGLLQQKVALDAYCQMLSDNPVQDDWSKSEKMAYWINAYNAFTLKLIVDHYPTTSILNFDNGKTWDVKRIRLGSRKYSLNQIENDILRPEFKDARIHFAINCAARSCPPLWNRAYTAENLETALETRTRAFINDLKYNTLTASSARVSKIFEWYSADFGDLRAFLNQYAEQEISKTAAIKFQEYNWSLNE